MNWDVSRDGPMNTHYFKSYWLENLFWSVAPGFLGRFVRESSPNWRGVRDIEASGMSDSGQESSAPQDLAGQEVHIDEGSNGNNKTFKEDDNNEAVFICLMDKRSNSWRLSHAKVRRTGKSEARATREGQREIVEDENNRNEESPNLSGMDKSLFQALRQKLLRRQISFAWRWLTPKKLSGIEFWEVRLCPLTLLNCLSRC
jgi:hypothetical protein